MRQVARDQSHISMTAIARLANSDLLKRLKPHEWGIYLINFGNHEKNRRDQGGCVSATAET
jgi:hypothetical protein